MHQFVFIIDFLLCYEVGVLIHNKYTRHKSDVIHYLNVCWQHPDRHKNLLRNISVIQKALFSFWMSSSL